MEMDELFYCLWNYESAGTKFYADVYYFLVKEYCTRKDNKLKRN